MNRILIYFTQEDKLETFLSTLKNMKGRGGAICSCADSTRVNFYNSVFYKDNAIKQVNREVKRISNWREQSDYDESEFRHCTSLKPDLLSVKVKSQT